MPHDVFDEGKPRESNEDLEGPVSERTLELARINEALLDQTRFLHQVLDTSPQLVFVKDWAGRYTLANQALADLHGTTVDRLIGKTDADFHRNAEEVRALLETDREVMTTRRLKVIAEDPATDQRTGMVRWFHTIKAPLVGRDGTCNRMLGLSTDITARHFAEGELRRASDELRALFDASPLAICGLTSDGYVRSWNRAAEQLFGWTAGEVVGRPLPIVPSELQAEYRGLCENVLSGNPATNIESHRVRNDGEVIAVSVSTAPVHDANGRINGIVVVYVDIRDRKELEAQLLQAQKMEAVGQLAGGVAHDFNNLLTVIQTASELLIAEMKPGDKRREDVQHIEDAASRAASLTRQLLAYSRQQVLEPRVVDLNQVVAGIELMARRVVQENITVVTRLADDLHRVTADPHQLDRVILNLVVNARDAMPEGGTLLIETGNVLLDEHFQRTHPSARPGPHVMLGVTDTGCGMDDGTRARIFEPFFTTKPIGVGTGLGLATVYGIVKQSGGHIWVQSEVGRGSSFRIYLPVCAVAGADSDPASAAHNRGDAAAYGSSDATILVVEDDAAVRNAVCRVLERRGYDVLESWNGEQALAVLGGAQGSVDLVISDIVMPKMSGLELRDRLKEIRPAVPVLLMSGYSREAITRLGNQESLGPLIEKPFTMAGLLENVGSVLRG
jgi:PAS domain S-box-containing protein